MPFPSRSIAAALLGAALAACAHGEPLSTPDTGSTRPFAIAAPTRLTYNPGVDRDAAWLPDESGIIYSADRLDRDDDDRCLVTLAPTGGRIERTWCASSLPSRDSINTFDGAAVTAGGRVAFVRTSRPPTFTAPRFNELAAGPLASIDEATVLQSIPFTQAGVFYTGISQLRWAGDQTLVYRAGFLGPVCIDAVLPRCGRAVVESGLNLMRQDSSDGPVLVPGTVEASSVAVMPDADAILFTRLGDSRVFRHALSSGLQTVYYDFGGTAIARGVQASNGRLVAIVGGAVQVLSPAFNPPGTPRLQYDLGGDVVVVELLSGATMTLHPGTGGYRNPALSPSGKRLVVERDGDLWLFELQ